MNLSFLGQTRSARRSDHLLHTPDTFVRAPLPNMRQCTAIVHVSPARCANFTQYTAEFERGGWLGSGIAQRFLFVIEGEIRIGEIVLATGGYAYQPLGAEAVEAIQESRVAIIEKVRIKADGLPTPGSFVGREVDIAPTPLLGDEAIAVQSLIPEDPAFDFAMNLMTYQPGATLPMVEVHVMEHGLLMLSGGGIYRLNDSWYPVTAGDFIWMGPYCPQWFAALGKEPAKYLLYKDRNRHPLCG